MHINTAQKPRKSMRFPKAPTLAVVALTFLASACETVPTSPVTQPVTLGGTALQLQNAGMPFSPTPIGSTAMVVLTGGWTENSGETTISDGTYLLVDPDGFDANGVLTDGAVYIVALDGAESGLFTGLYEYVAPIAYTYQNGAGTMSVLGNIGIMADAADVPVSGVAQYSGEAFARVESSDGSTGFLLSGGVSIVDVNFATGLVDVSMGLFANVDQYAPTTIAPIDSIIGTGMTIAGASFVGGSWVTLKGSAVVDFTGPTTSVSVGGDFYGYDPLTSAPDEVGGVILMDGSTGVVYGIYAANLL